MKIRNRKMWFTPTYTTFSKTNSFQPHLSKLQAIISYSQGYKYVFNEFPEHLGVQSKD